MYHEKYARNEIRRFYLDRIYKIFSKTLHIQKHILKYFFFIKLKIFNVSFHTSSGSVKDSLISNLPYNIFVIMNNARKTHLTEEKNIQGKLPLHFQIKVCRFFFHFSFNQGFSKQYFQIVPVRTLTIASFVTFVCLVLSHP